MGREGIMSGKTSQVGKWEVCRDMNNIDTEKINFSSNLTQKVRFSVERLLLVKNYDSLAKFYLTLSYTKLLFEPLKTIIDLRMSLSAENFVLLCILTKSISSSKSNKNVLRHPGKFWGINNSDSANKPSNLGNTQIEYSTRINFNCGSSSHPS